jgi:hypothetical protein
MASRIRRPLARVAIIAVAVTSLVLTLRLASAAEKDGGKVIEPFNGKDLTGWHYQGEKDDVLAGKTESTDGRYTAKDGVIVVHDSKEPDAKKRIRQLWTVQEFPGDFELTFEFRAEVNADSGFFVRKPQLQVRDYLVAGPYKELKKYKPQDWNQMVVVVKGNVAHCACNGEVLEAALKVPATGGIGLEADHGQMEYRNIRIKELK